MHAGGVPRRRHKEVAVPSPALSANYSLRARPRRIQSAVGPERHAFLGSNSLPVSRVGVCSELDSFIGSAAAVAVAEDGALVDFSTDVVEPSPNTAPHIGQG